MPTMFKIAFAMLLSATVAQVYGQGTSASLKAAKAPTLKVAPKGPPPIKNEMSFGYRLNTDGWGIYMDYGMVKAKNAKLADMFYNVQIFQVEFSEKKHPKQQKITVQDASENVLGRYVYGKINNFYALKVGYGFRKLIAGKPDPGSVSIHWTNLIGGCLGMVKPYYLNTDINPAAIRYSDDNRPDFLDQRYIISNAGFSEGLGELKMVPGGQFKSMLHFDFAASKQTVTAIETGLSAEYYATPVAIMYNQKAEPFYVNLFVSFQFGKRW